MHYIIITGYGEYWYIRGSGYDGAGYIKSVRRGDDLHTAQWEYEDSNCVVKPDYTLTIRYEGIFLEHIPSLS